MKATRGNLTLAVASAMVTVIVLGCAAAGVKRFLVYDDLRQDRNGRVFEAGETVWLFVELSWHKGKVLTCQIQKGGQVVFREQLTVTSNFNPLWSQAFSVPASDLYAQGGAGTYSVYWLIDGRQARAQTFTLAGPSPSQHGLIVTRLQDVVPGRIPRETDTFGRGEIPTFFIHGYGGETVTLEIRDLRTGAVMMSETRYVSRGTDWYPTFTLPSGSYRATLAVSGVSQHTALFNVLQ